MTNTTTTTPWGKATVKEIAEIKQTAPIGDFATIIELLVREDGETMVRFAYATGEKSTARRGPVTLRSLDLQKLRKALVKTPELAAALLHGVGGGGGVPGSATRPARASPAERAR